MSVQPQVLNYTDAEMLVEANQILEKGYTFYHEQNITQPELIDHCRRIGDTDDDSMGDLPFNPKDNPDIARVMVGGLFGTTDLHWHSNGAMHHLGEYKEIIIALYCKNECRDTVFSILNTKDAFSELPEEEKDYWRSIDMQLNNFDRGIYGSEEGADADNSLDSYKNNPTASKPLRHDGNDCMPVVNIHPVGGEEFIYWQPPMIEKAWQNGNEIDVDIIRDKLKTVLDRSIYQKHFVFKKGDLLIMDQLYTVHRRSHVVDKIRELWRVAFDYSTIIKN